MKLFLKWMILSHRYLGIALSLLFVVWFASGIGMIYTGGMPSLTPELRMERLTPLDLARVRVTPAEALELAFLDSDPDSVTLLMLMDRPAYRMWIRGASVTVFADNGELLAGIGKDEAVSVASRFMNLPPSQIEYAGLVTDADQWTVGFRGDLPAHKIVVEDPDSTQLYIPEYLGEVTVLTTRGSRMAAWVAAIPHWLYFTPLRANDELWRQVVLWTSGLGCLLALVGIVIGVMQFSPSRPYRLGRLVSYLPYRGLMRWHYLTGLVFGVLTLTWVFSGMLSMDPWFWAPPDGAHVRDISGALAGGRLDMTQFPALDDEAWSQTFSSKSIKEIEFRRIQGDPYLLLRDAGLEQDLVRAETMDIRREPFNAESLIGSVQAGYPQVPVVESRRLEQYDSYYYPRADSSPPLPVFRVKFDDPARTWVYVDPELGQLVGLYDRMGRLNRWLFNGLHSLDFSFWYYNRPIWEIGVIVLSVGGIATSGIGMFLGFRRLGRGLRRRFQSQATRV